MIYQGAKGVHLSVPDQAKNARFFIPSVDTLFGSSSFTSKSVGCPCQVCMTAHILVNTLPGALAPLFAVWPGASPGT
jgi:gamma-glutamyltranspeptidase